MQHFIGQAELANVLQLIGAAAGSGRHQRAGA
jgi:hypothetical protein